MNNDPVYSAESLPVGRVLSVLVQHILNSWQLLNTQSTSVLLSAAGLNPNVLEHPSGYVSLNVLERLVQTATASGTRLLGLHLSQHVDPASFGILGYIRQACGNLNEVIRMTMRYECLVSDIGSSQLSHSPGIAYWNWECISDNAVFCQQADEYLMGVWLMTCRRLTDLTDRSKIKVCFRHSISNPKLQAEYEQLLCCPVYFNQPKTGLLIPVALLHHPLTHPDPILQETLEQHAQRLLKQLHQHSPLEPIRLHLHRLIHQGKASRESLAQSLGISTRHLHRLLARHQISYRELLSTIRLEVAESSLRNSDDNITTIAKRLGFSDSQSFIRWFRTHTGHTPLQFRLGRESSGEMQHSSSQSSAA